MSWSPPALTTIPGVPAFAAGLDGAIVQLHSSQYRNRSQLRNGGVLVVGAGNSGAEIAIELAGHHRTWLSGPDTGQEPTRAGSIPDRLFTPIMWLMATRLTVRTSMGRKLRDHFLDPPRGIPLGRVRRKDIIAAGIERVGRTTGVRDGYPLLEDGRVLEVSNVIWCTGYTPDFSWVDLALPPTTGSPSRTEASSSPSLAFTSSGSYSSTHSAQRLWAEWAGTPSTSSTTSLPGEEKEGRLCLTRACKRESPLW